MKSYVSTMFVIAIIAFGQNALAAKFDFNYSYEGEKLSVSQEASDYYQALEIAAKNCFKHFKSKTKSNQEKGIEVIDVCANPRST